MSTSALSVASKKPVTSHRDELLAFVRRAHRAGYCLVQLVSLPDETLILELDLVDDLEGVAEELDHAQVDVGYAAGPGAYRNRVIASGGKAKRTPIVMPLTTYVGVRPDQGADATNEFGLMPGTSQLDELRMRLRHEEMVHKTLVHGSTKLVQGWEQVAKAREADCQRKDQEIGRLCERIAELTKSLHAIDSSHSDALTRHVELQIEAKRADVETEGQKKVIGLLDQVTPVLLQRFAGAKPSVTETPVIDLLRQFFSSLEEPQFAKIFVLLNDGQKIVLGQIMKLAEPPPHEPINGRAHAHEVA